MLALLPILVMLDAGAPKPAPPAPPPVYFTLLDAAGTSKTVIVQSLEGETLSTTDLEGRRRNDPLSRVIMISRSAMQPPQVPRLALAPSEAPTESPSGIVRTIDGQVIAGNLVGGAEKDALLWRSEVTGTLRVPLDLLKRLDCVYPPNVLLGAGVPITTDTLFLRNGDVVRGFVDSIGATVQIETGETSAKQMVKLPRERVEAIVLAQNLTPAKGAVVATRGGIVVQVRSPRLHDRHIEGELLLGEKNEKLKIDDNELETLVFDAGRVQPLSLSTFHNTLSGSGRTWTQPLEFHQGNKGDFGSEIEFPGPMQVDCDLPRGSQRLLFHAELPHSCRTWGDAELVLSVKQGSGFKEMKRLHLSGDTPEVDVNLELGGAAQLRMTVEAGKAGPIQDRVLLRKALILIDPALDKSKATPGTPNLR